MARRRRLPSTRPKMPLLVMKNLPYGEFSPGVWMTIYRLGDDMGRYRKIDPRIWNDEKFSLLSDKAKLLFLFPSHASWHDRAGCYEGDVTRISR